MLVCILSIVDDTKLVAKVYFFSFVNILSVFLWIIAFYWGFSVTFSYLQVVIHELQAMLKELVLDKVYNVLRPFFIGISKKYQRIF